MFTGSCQLRNPLLFNPEKAYATFNACRVCPWSISS
ncbi:hypothetical protein PF003_g7049 [Phytophthora fragariae]|nr:hypothetical protein PF003_g7049 [Phytophthora fragariae]